MTHICVSKLTIIGSDNDLSPERRQAIIWTNAGILLIGPLGTNFSEIFIEIHAFSFKKMHFKMSSAKWRLFGLGLNVLIAVSKRGPCRLTICVTWVNQYSIVTIMNINFGWVQLCNIMPNEHLLIKLSRTFEQCSIFQHLRFDKEYVHKYQRDQKNCSKGVDEAVHLTLVYVSHPLQ